MQLRENIKEFEKRGAQVLLVVAQPSSRSRDLLKAANYEPADIPYPILSDPAMTVSATYGLAHQRHGSYSRPATFIIDQGGVIRFEYRAREIDDRPEAHQLLAFLDRLAGKEVPLPPLKPRPPDAKRKARVNSADGAELVHVPAGTFTMGHTWNPKYEKIDPGVAHEQRVGEFWMYAKEVTNGQYRKFLKARPEWAPGRIDPKFHDGNYLHHWEHDFPVSKADDHPVVFVPWHAARAYAAWAGGRLPTEAEWDYAACAGRQLLFSTPTGKMSREFAHWRSGAGTRPVGSFPANPWGLYDLAGNAMEWTSSLRKAYPYSATDGREDPDKDGDRVVRGGSWLTIREVFLRNNLGRRRLSCWGNDCSSDLGFRCVVPADPAGAGPKKR